jgi:hypothetical protein
LSGFFVSNLGYLNREPNFVLMDNNQPIGIFDSGIGGTSIWKKSIITSNEKTIYLMTVRMLLWTEIKKKLLH